MENSSKSSFQNKSSLISKFPAVHLPKIFFIENDRLCYFHILFLTVNVFQVNNSYLKELHLCLELCRNQVSHSPWLHSPNVSDQCVVTAACAIFEFSR